MSSGRKITPDRSGPIVRIEYCKLIQHLKSCYNVLQLLTRAHRQWWQKLVLQHHRFLDDFRHQIVENFLDEAVAARLVVVNLGQDRLRQLDPEQVERKAKKLFLNAPFPASFFFSFRLFKKHTVDSKQLFWPCLKLIPKSHKMPGTVTQLYIDLKVLNVH